MRNSVYLTIELWRARHLQYHIPNILRGKGSVNLTLFPPLKLGLRHIVGTTPIEMRWMQTRCDIIVISLCSMQFSPSTRYAEWKRKSQFFDPRTCIICSGADTCFSSPSFFIQLPFGSGTRFTHRLCAANCNIYKPMSFRYADLQLLIVWTVPGNTAGVRKIKQKLGRNMLQCWKNRLPCTHESQFGKNTHIEINMKYLRKQWHERAVHAVRCTSTLEAIRRDLAVYSTRKHLGDFHFSNLKKNTYIRNCHQLYITSCIAHIGQSLCS